MKKTIIHIDAVNRCFRTARREEVWALRNCNLTCSEGEFLCLLGSSGCGKTTMLRLLCGLDSPTSGTISINASTPSTMQHNIGFVSQHGDLLPWRRVIDNVALGLEIRGIPRAKRKQQAAEALRRVQLPADTAHSYIHELSGGMRQRVALARALCISPRMLLMDEPFGHLDEPTRHALQDDLVELWSKDRKTIIFVTHSIEEAVFLADRIVIMESGTTVTDISVNCPRPRDRFSAAFLETARTVRAHMHDPSKRSEE